MGIVLFGGALLAGTEIKPSETMLVLGTGTTHHLNARRPDAAARPQTLATKVFRRSHYFTFPSLYSSLGSSLLRIRVPNLINKHFWPSKIIHLSILTTAQVDNFVSGVYAQ
jgi:hypothetical protein